MTARQLVEGQPQPVDLDRVAQLGARAVGLQVSHGGRVDAGRRVGAHDHRGLPGGVGRGQRPGPAAVVDRGAAQQPPNPVPTRRAGPGQYDQAQSFSPDESVRAGVERLAPPGRAEHAGAAEQQVVVRRQDQVDASGDRDVALPGADRGGGAVDRDQGAGAAGVDRLARPAQIQQVGHPVDQDGVRGRGGRVRIDGHVRAAPDLVVVAGPRADEQPDRPAGERAGRQAGVLQRGPHALQQQPLLGVHAGGFLRRDPEEQRIEHVGVADEAAAPGGYVGGQGSPVPPVRGHVGDQVVPGDQMVPEVVQVAAAGQPRGHPDHRDQVVGSGPRRGAQRRLGFRRLRYDLRIPFPQGGAVVPVEPGDQCAQGGGLVEQGGRHVETEGVVEPPGEQAVADRVEPVVADLGVQVEILDGDAGGLRGQCQQLGGERGAVVCQGLLRRDPPGCRRRCRFGGSCRGGGHDDVLEVAAGLAVRGQGPEPVVAGAGQHRVPAGHVQQR
ncbi:hypothetical protein EES47_29845 [Streptomyces sp. ADI98-12]|nr:hypothetical protein EES47_29845 [Streptomyces sp. ADI98-12]